MRRHALVLGVLLSGMFGALLLSTAPTSSEIAPKTPAVRKLPMPSRSVRPDRTHFPLPKPPPLLPLAPARPTPTPAPGPPPLPVPVDYWSTYGLLTRLGVLPQQARVGAAIAAAESGYRWGAVNVNYGGSVDRGLFQINSYYHAEVSPACAFDPICSTREAVRISGGGWNWTPWSTFLSGAYWRYLQ